MAFNNLIDAEVIEQPSDFHTEICDLQSYPVPSIQKKEEKQPEYFCKMLSEKKFT